MLDVAPGAKVEPSIQTRPCSPRTRRLRWVLRATSASSTRSRGGAFSGTRGQASWKRSPPRRRQQQEWRRQQQQQQQQRNEERTRQQQPQQQNSAAAPFSSTLSGAEEAVAVSAFGDAATTTTSAKAKARDKDEDKDEDKDGAQEVAAAMAAAQRRFERVAAAHECLSSSDLEPGQEPGQGCRSAFDQGDGVWAVFANSEQVEAAKEVGLALHLLSKEKAERAGFGLPDLEDEVREAYWPHESLLTRTGTLLCRTAQAVPQSSPPGGGLSRPPALREAKKTGGWRTQLMWTLRGS
mmetsp:Transcript_83389/g.166956  ORF Transcript_83389/g.166956 Transcript_83389/m.166956 type:complete len:295 (+) Transcript_83389:447-1331(+)